MRLGDWTPPMPMQVIGITKIAEGLYDLRAVGIMVPAQSATDGVVIDMGVSIVHVDTATEGVKITAFSSPEYHAIINCLVAQAKAFAAYYGGVAHLQGDKILIKAIAPGMRKEIANLTSSQFGGITP